MKIKIICKKCQTEFEVYPSRLKYDHTKFCSWKCRVEGFVHPNKGKGKFVMVECKNCGKETKRQSWDRSEYKFCSKKCMYKFQKGENHPMFGKHPLVWNKGKIGIYSVETIQKMNETRKKNGFIPTSRKGTVQSKETKQKIREVSLKMWNNKEFHDNRLTGEYKKCLLCQKEFYVSPSQKRVSFCSMSCAIKTRWKDKEYKERVLAKTLKGLLTRPTLLEKQMIGIIQKHNLPYKYTGNGDFWIGGKNPDFVNVNGEKKLIEIGCKYWKNRSDGSEKNYIKNRSEHFSKYGWKSFIFIQDKLNENEIIQTLKGERL